MSTTAKVWMDGLWMDSHGCETFSAFDPSSGTAIGDRFPVSDWIDCERALAAADAVFQIMCDVPRDRISRFLESYAAAIEHDSVGLAELAHQETGLPITPRLKDVELPRTVSQLRQAAAACREGSWALPTIDSKAGIRSVHAAIGPVLVIGPNNFPFAFNGISGGDFAAAIAAGNPVIAKGHPSHPGTTLRLAGLASKCLSESGLPSALVQLIYRMPGDIGLQMIGDHRLASVGFTGSKSAGLKIKQVCDQHGKPAYLEMSSINPVLILPAALNQRAAELAQEFSGSCLMGAGQFCTNPGLIILVGEANSLEFLSAVKEKFIAAPTGTLLSRQVLDSVLEGIAKVHAAGAELLTGGRAATDNGRMAIENSLLHVSGQKFLENPTAFQTEMFGPVSLIVTAKDVEQARAILQRLEGNLTGCIYSSADGSDEAAYARLAPVLRQRVGRLLNDKMPTGVAVSAAMNHGGPFPATGHPGFTAVGIPASLRRFSALHCYDNVRPERLPLILQDANPSQAWRLVDGQWTQ
ncbi:MAG: aldehyde dehydrogenase (NADP(+)) [Planctomycetaceae bacterium]|nr:aldehyde dehydrogenase (NADP(+)) [Planctomycetaceae bacterium]